MTDVKNTSVNTLAQSLNETLSGSAPEVLALLSGYGRRIYFPEGILTQSAEAAERAHRYDATIGIAKEGAEPMHLHSVGVHLSNLDARNVYPYAPAAGRPELRRLWRDKLRSENPGLAEKNFGLPITTAAITHGLGLAGDLFVDPGDLVLLPDKFWGNYRLNFEVRLAGQIVTFPFYSGGGFNCEGFESSLRKASEDREKLVVLLNFPNNPTGYMPTREEGERIVATLLRQAERGTRLVVLIDDAYFGLFYHLGGPCMTESLFGLLTGLHENLLAVKLDGATKEYFVWGLRCGFITFGPGRPESAEVVCEVLEAKVKGAIRAGISNVSHLSQSLIEKALLAPDIMDERNQKARILCERAERAFEVAGAPRFAESWNVYPFNSGYFMCVEIKGVDAEKLRVHLLDQYGVGLIATSSTDLRVAFSCLETEDIEPLFESLHRAVQELT
ncbi:MAG: aminotransferase class I/II-fold pyridoxal phosphate-dependent enzyme [Myxococcota bacterium]